VPTVGAFFVVFAAWQVLNHLVFMQTLRLSMLAYHLLSFAVETAAAAFIAVFVLRAVLRKNRELDELNHLKDLLMSSLVHDLRQPLTALLAGLPMIERDRSCSAETREIVAICRAGGERLLGMVNDLLDISRLESAQPLIRSTSLSPREFIRPGVSAVEQLAKEHGIALTTELPESLSHIEGDGERLRRVVMNLVGNALKFTPAGGQVSVSAREDNEAGRLVVTVVDTGPGITKELQSRVFDKFAVLDTAASAGRSSSGLGLTFSKMVVEAHGGEIWVESEPGEGSSFVFSLPLRQAEGPEAPRPHEEPPQRGSESYT
jgi:signal transduction histidine kinase